MSVKKYEDEDSLYGGWWLRSPGKEGRLCASIDTCGAVLSIGEYEGLYKGIRPVMWINLE